VEASLLMLRRSAAARTRSLASTSSGMSLMVNDGMGRACSGNVATISVAASPNCKPGVVGHRDRIVTTSSHFLSFPVHSGHVCAGPVRVSSDLLTWYQAHLRHSSL
jgi:hypothetical protein